MASLIARRKKYGWVVSYLGGKVRLIVDRLDKCTKVFLVSYLGARCMANSWK
jgi:hypothetical protein